MMHLKPTVVGVPKETSLLGLLLMLPVGGADMPMVIDWSRLSQEATGRSDSCPITPHYRMTGCR
jgi:hypothetical protein